MKSKQIDLCFTEAQADFAVALHQKLKHKSITKEQITQIVVTEATSRDAVPCEFDPKHFENAAILWMVAADIP